MAALQTSSIVGAATEDGHIAGALSYLVYVIVSGNFAIIRDPVCISIIILLWFRCCFLLHTRRLANEASKFRNTPIHAR